MDRKWRVAFLCKRNSCRSQIAEALGNMYASDVMECYSAGVAGAESINAYAADMFKEAYGVDLNAAGHCPKMVSDLPEIDIIIYMGCNVESAQIPCEIEMDWGIKDPCKGTDENFIRIVKGIERNVRQLRKDIISGRINSWRREAMAVDFGTVFPFWDKLTDAEKDRIDRCWRTEVMHKNQQIFQLSDGGKGLMVVRTGCLRVYIISDEGRDVTLYRLFPGDVCVLSANYLLPEIDFDVIIEAAEETETVTIPIADLEQIMKENLLMENYIYKKTAERFSDVMWTVQQILFKKIDQRIAQFLWEEMQHHHTDVITATHDTIARDIGSSREIVTKVMKHLTENQVIESSYGKVHILDKEKLLEIM